jgi:hypothetical protein
LSASINLPGVSRQRRMSIVCCRTTARASSSRRAWSSTGGGDAIVLLSLADSPGWSAGRCSGTPVGARAMSTATRLPSKQGYLGRSFPIQTSSRSHSLQRASSQCISSFHSHDYLLVTHMCADTKGLSNAFYHVAVPITIAHASLTPWTLKTHPMPIRKICPRKKGAVSKQNMRYSTFFLDACLVVRRHRSHQGRRNSGDRDDRT